MPPATPVRPRSFEKCDQCRRKKIRCTPEDRDDFHTSGRKCDQCFKAGVPCSANTRVLRRSQQNQTTATTPLTQLSPNSSFNSFLDAEPPQIGLNDLRIQSPAQSLENVFSPAQSLASNFESESWRSEESQYINARAQLRDMGRSVELYEYCQRQKNALLAMTQALPLLDFSQSISSLDMLLQIVFMPILTTLRSILQLIQRPTQLTAHEAELVCRRALDIGHRLSRCGGHFEPGRNSNFSEILGTFQNELIKLYISQNDTAEANLLRTTPLKSGCYLEGLTLEALSPLSKSLLTTIDSAVKDVLETSRRGLNLDPGHSSRITATHLALLSDRLNGTVKPDDVGLDMSCDMAGRNALHIAAERADLEYLKMWFQSIQKDPQLLADTKDRRDVFGLTPLMVSAYQGSADAFRLLLDAGANPKLQTPSGKSLLCLAAMAGNADVVKEILDRGIQVQEHINYCSPIHDAAATGRSEAVIHLLLKHKAEPRYEHHEYPNQRASEVARRRKHGQIAQILDRAEKKLDERQPISDASELVLKNLQQQLNHIANSNSPGSPSTTVSTSRRSPSIEPSRRVKRQRSIYYENHSPSMSSSSTSSTPRVRPINPAGPSPLNTMTTGPYTTISPADLISTTHGSLEFDFLNPSSDYSLSDLDAYCAD